MKNTNNLNILVTPEAHSFQELGMSPGYEHLREIEFCARATLDTSNCLVKMADTPTHLPADQITVREMNLERDNKTSPTNIGLYLASLVAMRDMGILSPDIASRKIDEVLTTLSNIDKYEGLYYNWYGIDSGEAYSSGGDKIISTVDNAWLAVGLMTIKNAGIGDTSKRAETLFDEIDISRLYDPETELFYGHYNVTKGSYSAYHNDVLLSETRIASYLGMSKGWLPVRHFDTLGHHAPAGQSGPTSSTIDDIKSWGGSMFEALMPTLFVDEGYSEDLNDTLHKQVRAQMVYGDRHLGGHWGVSVCLTPKDGYQEFGVHSNAMSESYRETSVITPHAKVLALPFARDAVIQGLMRDQADYPDCYKKQLGFCDSIDTGSGEVSDTFLALDQAMIFLALYNDWQKDTGGIRRYTSAELTGWRALLNQDVGYVAVQYSNAA